ncbi:MAG: DUF1844 domain-containing protein [Nitrospinota bacterium]
MSEEGEERKGFTVTDRRFSKKDSDDRAEESPADPEPAGESRFAEAPREEQPGPAQGVDFPGFVLSLANTALINMGAVPDPQGNNPELHLDGAKQMIDILGILKEKTQGNLTQEEDQLLNEVLSELRMRYIQVVRAPLGGDRTT